MPGSAEDPAHATTTSATTPRDEEDDVPKATWNGATIAESPTTVMVEGNHYFPPDSVDRRLLRPSDRTTVCPWKGTASYFDVVVDGKVNSAAAWVYPEPKEKAAQIAGYIAFWGGIDVTD